MREAGYGSEAFARVARNERVLVYIEGSGPRALLKRAVSGAVERAWYRRRLPAVSIRLTDSPAGRMISEHLSVREGRRFRFRDAQGVLSPPSSFDEYLRGRHRQALRTNVRRARASGLQVPEPSHETWRPPPGDIREAWIGPGPVERWQVLNADGEMVAYSLLSVDTYVALLHGLVSTVTDARWLLHTAIVERLCGHCERLITNSAAMYRESYGNHHFQRLLGYEIARLRPTGLIVGAPAPDQPLAAPRRLAQTGAVRDERHRNSLASVRYGRQRSAIASTSAIDGDRGRS